MWSKHEIVDIESTFSGCVRPACIPRGGYSRLFPIIGFERFFLEGCRKYGFDTIEGVRRFGFEINARDSSEIKPIRSSGKVTVVLVHSNIVFYKCTNRYQIR